MEAVKKLELPAEPGLACIGGETKTSLAIRNCLLNKKDSSKRNLNVKPFWGEGKKALE